MKQGADRCHWPLMVAAVAMTWLAALAKEIGITIVSPSICMAWMIIMPSGMLLGNKSTAATQRSRLRAA